MAVGLTHSTHSVWQHSVQVAATNFITELGAKHTEQMKLCLPLIVPVLSGAVADSKLQVKVQFAQNWHRSAALIIGCICTCVMPRPSACAPQQT